MSEKSTLDQLAEKIEETYITLSSVVKGKDFNDQFRFNGDSTALEVKRGIILIGCKNEWGALNFQVDGLFGHGDKYALEVKEKPNLICHNHLYMGEWDDGCLVGYAIRKYLVKYLKMRGTNCTSQLADSLMKLPKVVADVVSSKVDNLLEKVDKGANDFMGSINYLPLYHHEKDKFCQLFEKLDEAGKIKVVKQILNSTLRNVEVDQWLTKNYSELVTKSGRDNLIEIAGEK